MDEKTINALCEKFHTTVDYLIPTYSRYMIHKDISIIAICVILTILAIILTQMVNKKAREKHGEDMLDWDISEILIVLIGGVVAFTTFLCLMTYIYDLTLWITSPEMRFFDVVFNSN